MSKIKFSKDFLWGGAFAAEQSEGHGNTGKGETVWDEFFRKDPKAFHDQIGPNITSDFFNKYNEDIEMFKSFGTNSIRLGISWARIIPDGKTFSQKGIDFYHSVIKKCKEQNIEVILNIFHFDMPLWAHKKGGWESREVIDDFVEYSKKVFDEYGKEVKYIATFNEPGVPIIAGYQDVNHLPRIRDNKKAFQAGFGILLAHAKVVNLFNEQYRKKLPKTQIGVVININPPIVKDGISEKQADKKAAFEFDLLHNQFWLYPMIKGEMPKGGIEFAKINNVIPNFIPEDIEEISKVKIDFLGANYYSPSRIVAADPKADIFFDRFKTYKFNKARYNVFRGWEIKPDSLYELSMIIKNEFNNIPFYISENGMGVEGEENYRDKNSGEIQDDYRIAFLQEHLHELNKAIKDGANCFGYHMWAIMDNWSWRNAYKNRYGFIEVNLKDQSRKLKKSAYWFKECIKNNGFEDNYKKIEETIDLKKVKFTKSV